MKNAIIIGKGPAGISAAIYLKRAGMDITVIGKDLGALSKSHKIENYYGFENPLSGEELLNKGIKQAENLGIEVISDEVVDITKEKNYVVKTSSGEFETQTVLIATGKSRQKLDVEGFEEYKGKGISFCAVCDGFFYRGKTVAVIGNGDYAATEASELSNFAKEVIVFTDSDKLDTQKLPSNIKVVNGKIEKIVGDETVSGIVVDGETYDTNGIFVAIGTASASDFALKLGVFTKKDDIIIDEDYMTNVGGLFAAGDCTGGFLQVATAVADGANASRGIMKYIKNTR